MQQRLKTAEAAVAASGTARDAMAAKLERQRADDLAAAEARPQAFKV